MAQIPTQTVTVASTLKAAATAAAASQTAECGPGVFAEVTNGDSASHTLTIAIPGTLDSGDAYPDKVYTIVNGTTRLIPLPNIYKDPTDRLAHFTWSATTSMSCAIIKI